MSVLIKGMKMPISCHECVAGYGGFCFVAPPESDANCPNEGRPEWCPLIEIPPHGRLIDADALIEKYGEWYTEEGIKTLIHMVSTVIPAEEVNT